MCLTQDISNWDFQRIDEILLAPVIKALEPVANISVESQVLYHTPKSSFSYWDEKWIATYLVPKIFLSLYIPSAKECPLLLQLPNGEISVTNAFISPMWGGVAVWNPPGCSRDSESKHPARHTISPQCYFRGRPACAGESGLDNWQDLQKVFEIFMGQLRQLFGLKSDSLYAGASGTTNLLASERGFTEWELDVLSRQHTCFNLVSCATTLGSLSRLVQSLPRMIIMDEIGKQVKGVY
ncbi:GPI transamidase component PIG-S [Vitis vinifera]|uniref:GPI transamidase component PIG-S n=1 Tax=Vitis vinifera TaxID=29760 RepID=A0A438DDZ9_VITVI|nr:GPI transamidase component PIG-S [Vitis vinifera]